MFRASRRDCLAKSARARGASARTFRTQSSARKTRFAQKALNAPLPATSYRLFKEIIEGFTRAVGRLRLRLGVRFALDRHARRKQLARVSRIFRRDPRRYRLRAFEPLASVERFALGAAAQVGAAALASRLGRNRVCEHIAAARAPHHFVKTGHAWGAPFERLTLGLVSSRLYAICWRFRRLRKARRALAGTPLARCILIAPLPILTVRHSSLLALGF